MIVECCVSSKGTVTHVATQRINGKLIVVEENNRVDAMAALIHRVLELNAEKSANDLLLVGRAKLNDVFSIEDFNLSPVMP